MSRHLGNKQRVSFPDVLVSWEPNTQAVELFEEQREYPVFWFFILGLVFTHFRKLGTVMPALLNNQSEAEGGWGGVMKAANDFMRSYCQSFAIWRYGS